MVSNPEGDLENLGQIVLLGDSITQQSWTPELQGFGTRLSNDYARRLDVINRGFSGYTTNQALTLLPRIFLERKDSVKLVTVFFGANDSALEGATQHVPLDQFKSNLRHIYTCAPLRGKVLALTAPPLDNYEHDKKFGATRTAEHTKLYRDATLEVCEQLGVPVVDVWQNMMKAVGFADSDTALPGSWKRPQHDELTACFVDGLHPSLKGYKMIYESIVEGIKTFYPKLWATSIEMPTLYWPQAVGNPPGTLLRWHLSVDEIASECDRLCAILSEQERHAVKEFHFAKDQYLALGSILLQKLFITTILGSTFDMPINRDKNNRPYFKRQATRPHDYNVSHHGQSIVLAAIIEGGRIGIDLTVADPPQEPITTYLDNFEDSFSKVEWRAIDGSLEKFYQHWALKEAYVKAIGLGIVVDLPAIEFTKVQYVDADHRYIRDAAQLRVNGEVTPFTFELHYFKSRTYVAIATESSHMISSSHSFREITLAEVLKAANTELGD